MKKLLMVLIVLILLLVRFVFPADSVSLEGLSRPSILLVKYDRIYILEQASVYIYSLKDFKLIKKFGKAGEGPEEFKYNASDGKPLAMSFSDNSLMVSSDHRSSYFDLDGNYIKEEKVPVDKILFSIENGFVGVGPMPPKNKKQFLGFTIHDKNFTSQKAVFVSDVEINNPKKLILPITSFTYNPVYKNKIYINANSDDFIINVYNSNRNKEYTIKKNYPKIQIPKSFKKDALNFFKNSPRFKRSYEFIRKILSVRKNFPPIRDLQITEDHIYVITFKRQGNLWECIKMDLKGNEKGKTFIALNTYEHFTMYPLLYSIHKDNIYSLVEDEEDEIWKIHISKF